MSVFYKKFHATQQCTSEQIILNSNINIKVSANFIEIDIPFTATDSIFYKTQQFQIEFSNDIRLLIADHDELNPSGINSLLTLGAIVPPLTPFKSIKSLIPGFKHSIRLKTFEFTSTPSSNWSTTSDKDTQLTIEEQVKTLTGLLDAKIKESCPNENPLVLFSGGIDSSVIAQRVQSFGWKKAKFVHYSMSSSDPETINAKKIAAELGIYLEILFWNMDEGLQCLENAGRLYGHPFSDPGSPQMYDLMQQIFNTYPSDMIVLDGTGADGEFGIFKSAYQTQRLYNIPVAFKRLVCASYHLLKMWKRPIWVEYYMRLLRRATYLPKLTGYIARNPLMKIGYEISNNDLAQISTLCSDWIDSVALSNSDTELIPLLDVGLVCAKIFAQKNKSLFMQNSFNIAYPFLDFDMLDLAIQHARFWPDSFIPKNTLKYLLSQKISPDLVYRKKSGFLSAEVEIFSHPVLLNHLEQVIENSSPLSNFIHKKFLKNMLDLISNKRTLAHQSYNFIWTVAFINSWLLQLRKIPKDKLYGFNQN